MICHFVASFGVHLTFFGSTFSPFLTFFLFTSHTICKSPFVSNVVLLARTTSVVFFIFAFSKTWSYAAPRLVHFGGPGWLAASHQGAAPEVREVASKDSSIPSEAGTSSSSAWCAGSKGRTAFAKVATDTGLRVSPDIARAAAQEKREGVGSDDRLGGASSGCAPCRIEEGVRCSGGATSRRPNRTVRVIHLAFAETFDRAREATCDRGGALARSQGQVGEVAVRGRAGPRCTFGHNQRRRRVGTVACPSSRVATCRTRQRVCSIHRRPTSEETPREGRFCPHVCRGCRPLVKVQATGDGGRNLMWRSVRRRKVGFGHGRGGSPVADLDPTSIHIGQPHMSVQSLLDVVDGGRLLGLRELVPRNPLLCCQSRCGMRGARSHPGPLLSDNVRGSRDSGYGLRGVSVGEASHPGPSQSQLSTRGERTQSNRFMIFREDSTVPASTGAVHRVQMNE